ncbi:MAG: saccharopine dehydrogenase C-terminal domain-containing protein [Bacteroidota bacterium]
MNNILIIGAGRSSYPLIDYVLNEAATKGWFVTVADTILERAQNKITNHSNSRAVWLDVAKGNDRRDLINRSDVVISLLPAHLHLEVAHDCIKLNKPVLTAATITHEMYRLGDEARDRELVFTGEYVLDPGLDHMAAKKELDEIRAQGGKIRSFRAFTGGLMATDSLDNPWNYKLTWNPRNVVLEGQGTAQYLKKNKIRYITYHQLFQHTKSLDIPGAGTCEAFANRDALLFREVYGLQDVPNVYKGTIRPNGFCDAWNALIHLGLTDGDFPILHSGKISYYELLDGVTGKISGNTLKERVANLLGVNVNGQVIKQLQWLGLFSKKKIKLATASPALILEHLLREKWQLLENDIDRLIIHFEITYELNGQKRRRKSTMMLDGEDTLNTAMAKTLGLPIAMVLKLLMHGKIESKGAGVSVSPQVYEPVLQELESYGIQFKTTDQSA